MNYPLDDIKWALKDKLNAVCGSEWIVDGDNRDCLRRVSEWIHGADYRRGFTLRGPVGTGKSKVVEATSKVLTALYGKGIRRIEAVELVNIVAKAKGDRSVLEKYADHTVYPFLWIEDLDTEGNAPSFVTGDAGINCVAELIQVRYKRWEQGLKLTTGFTTNATNARLLERYGERCCSRMNHLSEVIPLPGPDRRLKVASLPPIQQRIEYPPPASDKAASEALAPIIAEFTQQHDLRLMERARADAERKAGYLDELRLKVRRMELAELHRIIQTDVFIEARDIARNHFNNIAPISYDEFCERLEAKSATA